MVRPAGSPEASIVTPSVSLTLSALLPWGELEKVVSEMTPPLSAGAKVMMSGPLAAAAAVSADRREPSPESALFVTVKVAAGSAGAGIRPSAAAKRVRRVFMAVAGAWWRGLSSRKRNSVARYFS